MDHTYISDSILLRMKKQRQKEVSNPGKFIFVYYIFFIIQIEVLRR